MTKPVVGAIHSFDSFGAVDGPGIRFVIFFQGCPLRCRFCHNPDTWDQSAGKLYTPEEIVSEILPYRPFLRLGGVTLSGGEPLYQPEFAAALLAQLKAEGFHTALDTSGGVPLRACQAAVDMADLLLLDIKALDPAVCQNLTGRDNRNALAILNHCRTTGKPVWIRHVLVPGYTLDPDQLRRLAVFLQDFSCVERVELLPFHQMGAYKWKELGLDYTLEDAPVPSSGQVEAAKAIFHEAGFQVN